MIEDELKKRLENLCRLAQNGNPDNNPNAYLALDTNMTLHDVMEIINEVAKEYPLPWYEWLRKQPEWQTYPETKIDLHDMWQRYAFEMIDWFKKYFGEQK